MSMRRLMAEKGRLNPFALKRQIEAGLKEIERIRWLAAEAAAPASATSKRLQLIVGPRSSDSFIDSSGVGFDLSSSQDETWLVEIPSKAASFRCFIPRSTRSFRNRSPTVFTSIGNAFRRRIKPESGLLCARNDR